MPDLFITYSRRNMEFVRRLVDALEKEGRDVWVDWEDIPPTVDWMKEIREGIDSSNNYIYVITPDSLNSKVCLSELEHALEQQKKLIPLLHQEVDLPSGGKERRGSSEGGANPLDRAYSALGFESDSERILEYLSPHNWVFFREDDDFDTAFATLSEALDDDQTYKRDHTRLLVRAREWDSKERDASFVLTGDAIKEAEGWLTEGEHKSPKPTELHRAYITASRLLDLQEKQYEMGLEQRAARRLRYLVGALTIFLVAAIGLSAVAFREQSRAKDARNAAEESAQLAIDAQNAAEESAQRAEDAQAIAERRAIEAESFVLAERARLSLENGDTRTSIRLALESVNLEDPPAAAQSVLSRAAYVGPRANFPFHSRDVVALATTEGGTLAASASSDGTSALWNVQTGETIAILEPGRRSPVNAVDFSADGSRVLMASDFGEILIVDAESGEALVRFSTVDEILINAAFRDSDSEILVASCQPIGEREQDCDIYISRWDDETGEEIDSYEFFYPEADNVAFSPDGRWAAIASNNASEAFIVDVRTAETLSTITTVRSNSAIAFSHTSQELALASGDGSVTIVNVFTGEQVERFQSRGFGRMSALAFNADNTLMAIGRDSGSIEVYDLQTQTRLREFSRHAAPVSAVAFVSEDTQVLSSGFDSSIMLWDLQHGAVLNQFGRQEGNEINGVTVSIDGTRVYAFTEASEIITFDSTTGAELQRLEVSEDIEFEDSIGPRNTNLTPSFNPDRTAVVTLETQLVAHLIDLETGEDIARYEGHEDSITSAVFSPDGETLYTGSWDGTVIAWDAASGELLYFFEGVESDLIPGILSLAISPDGGTLVAGTFDPDSIIIFDADSGDIISSFSTQQSPAFTVTLSPDANKVAIAGGGSTFTMWDLETGTQLLRFEGHGGDITSVLFNSDGSRLISGSDDQTIIVWDIVTGTPLRVLEDHTSAVTNVVFSPDENSIYSSSWTDGVIQWRLDDTQQLIEWTCQNRAVIDLSETERAAYGVTTTAPLCEVMGVEES
jgi:WD40 repeat protein